MKKYLRFVSTSLAMSTLIVGLSSVGTANAVPKGPNGTTIFILRSGLTSEQRTAVINEITQLGGWVSSTPTPANFVVVKASAATLSTIRANPFVSLAVPNGKIPGPSVRNVLPSLSQRSHAAVRHDTLASSLCGTQASPELDPEAVTNINAPAAWAAGATGAGVTVAYMAEGIDTSIADFQRNPAYASKNSGAHSPVFTDYQDFTGDGILSPTSGGEAFLDASSIGAQGNTAYDLSQYSSFVPSGCYIKVVGSAPGANLMGLKVFGANNWSTNTGFLEAIQYAVSHGVKVLNESFGSMPLPDLTANLVKAANDAAVAAGVTVVVSSGDAGSSNTMGSPASDPKVIAVGANTTYRSYAQTGYGGMTHPLASGGYVKNNISPLSSGGIAQSGDTVNLVAPGDMNWDLCSTSALYADCGGEPLGLSGGTSESAPLVAGAAADVIQAFLAAHGFYPTPAQVKSILMSTATNLNAPVTLQGAGLLNVGAAVALAKTYTVKKPKTAGGIVVSTNALHLSGTPGSTISSSVSVTNTSNVSTSLHLASVREVRGTVQSGTVTLNPAVGSTQPQFPIWSGYQEIYQTKDFTVSPGTTREQFQADFAYSGQSSLLHVAIFDPAGNLASYSISQGLADYVTMDLSNPTTGIWKAVFFTVYNGDGPTDVGTSGLVQWQVTAYNNVPTALGKVVVIKAGATTKISASLTMPMEPGDTSLALEVISASRTVVIPVTERTAVPVVAGSGNFYGVLTGGNGRAGSPAQMNTYKFTIPAGANNLEVDLELSNFEAVASNGLPGTQIVAMLLSPTGQELSYDTNVTFDNYLNAYTLTPYVSLYAATPVGGTYTYVVEFANPVVASAIDSAFHGQVLLNGVSVSGSLPNSASTVVSASAGGTYNINVTNRGMTPLNITADPRTVASVSYQISDLFGSPATQTFNNSWSYYVPPGTSAITTSQTSTAPASFDMSSYMGDPDLSPRVAMAGVTASFAPQASSLSYRPVGGVASGMWGVTPAPLGPFTSSTSSATATVTSRTSITTQDFDANVTTSTGDMVAYYTGTGDPTAGIIVPPGGTVTITVTINPIDQVGTVETGQLYIDAANLGNNFNMQGNYLVYVAPFIAPVSILPYAYTVGR